MRIPLFSVQSPKSKVESPGLRPATCDLRPATFDLRPSTFDRAACRAGFTLVEMLVVVLLIAVLSGLVFRLTTLANDRSAKAVTVARIAKLQAAIEEFYAEYGQYPPVPTYPKGPGGSGEGGQPLGYEYPIAEQLAVQGRANIIQRADNKGTDEMDAWSRAPIFTFGLMSFLVPRYNDIEDEDYQRFAGYDGGAVQCNDLLTLGDFRQWKNHNIRKGTKYNPKDNDRDVAACRRWWPYIQDIVSCWPSESHGTEASGYTNYYMTVRDGWDQDLHYKSTPPYQTYELWAEHGGKRIDGHAGH